MYPRNLHVTTLSWNVNLICHLRIFTRFTLYIFSDKQEKIYNTWITNYNAVTYRLLVTYGSPCTSQETVLIFFHQCLLEAATTYISMDYFLLAGAAEKCWIACSMRNWACCQCPRLVRLRKPSNKNNLLIYRFESGNTAAGTRMVTDQQTRLWWA